MIRVVDASVVSAAIFRGQVDTRIEAVLRAEGVNLVAPQLLRYEVANAVRQLVRRGHLLSPEAAVAFSGFADLEIGFVDSPGWPERAFLIAQQFGHGAIYDAIYLACAEDLGAELWTRDRRFVESFGDARPPLLRLYPDDIA